MAELREKLRAVLGNQRLELQATPRPDANATAGWQALDIEFSDGAHSKAWMIAPDHPAPAVLYCHAHGNTYTVGCDELRRGRPALQGPYGPDLAKAGFAAFCLDMPCFGSRQDIGESAAAKAGLWSGKPLFGRMLAELSAGFHWLKALPKIGPVATLGLSMGATQAYWLAALEPEIAATAHIACFADLAALIEADAHDLHGAYMTVPGLLPLARTGQIAGLVAPRPQMICAGRRDPLTPMRALEIGLADVTAAYSSAPDRLTTLIAPGLGHAESPDMRRGVLEFLTKALH
ncbi:MAG: hypothetical protein AAGF88_12895 [Pseudomonadota bacterium]